MELVTDMGEICIIQFTTFPVSEKYNRRALEDIRDGRYDNEGQSTRIMIGPGHEGPKTSSGCTCRKLQPLRMIHNNLIL